MKNGEEKEEEEEEEEEQSVAVESLSLLPLQHDPSLDKGDGQSLKITRREQPVAPPTGSKRKTQEESPAPEKKSKQK